MVTSFWAFLAVAVVVIVTPGQDTALTIRNTLLGGRRGGVLTAIGVSTGQATWAVATSVGVAALLTASEVAFLALKLVGAAYLVFLGGQTLLAARRRARRPESSIAGAPRALPARKALRQGIVSNLGNPKMAVFFPSLLPQFATRPSFGNLLFLGLIFCALTLVWLSAYAVAVARARAAFERPRVRRIMDAATGAALVALGLRLAAEQR
jgi:threonine/homoserine/homoserine lactone efflux protein